MLQPIVPPSLVPQVCSNSVQKVEFTAEISAAILPNAHTEPAINRGAAMTRRRRLQYHFHNIILTNIYIYIYI